MSHLVLIVRKVLLTCTYLYEPPPPRLYSQTTVLVSHIAFYVPMHYYKINHKTSEVFACSLIKFRIFVWNHVQLCSLLKICPKCASYIWKPTNACFIYAAGASLNMFDLSEFHQFLVKQVKKRFVAFTIVTYFTVKWRLLNRCPLASM